jgi:hypothetical protein
MYKRGFDLPQTKVPPEGIADIRAAAIRRVELRREITDLYSNRALAKRWGVHDSTIEKILKYEIARHLP